MHLSELVKRLCTQDQYPFVLQNKKKLAWTVQYSKIYDWIPDSDEVATSATVKAVWKYIEKFHSTPSSLADLKGYVINNPDHLKEFSRGSDDGKGEVTAILEQLDLLATWEPPATSIKEIAINVLLETAFSKIREAWHKTLYDKASKVATGIEAYKRWEAGEEREERGPAAAMCWLRMQWSKDYSDETAPVDGFLHENTQTLRATFADRLNGEKAAGRFPIGISHIDRAVVVGKQNLRFIGIAGQAGDGKTTLANFIVYTWLLHGAHGLYVSLEHTPKEVWDAMAYLHSSHEDYGGKILPPSKQWETNQISDDDVLFVRKIARDIETRRNLPGLLEVKDFPSRDWDTIEDWLTVHNAKNKYDFVMIDYIARLKMPGDQRFIDKEMGTLIHRIQNLTRHFDDSRGLIVLSPVPITKQAYAEASKGEFEEGEGRYDLNCIRQHSEFKDDMDLILSVWSDANMKDPKVSKIQVACIKKRKGSQPPAVVMDLAGSGAFGLGNEKSGDQPPVTRKVEVAAAELNLDENAYGMPEY